uniref:hypothetical protein n=1 Tax=Weissella soli TaxID=155866 RepID=UPI00359FC014
MGESLSDTLAKSIGPIPTLIFAVISFGATLYWQVTRKQYQSLHGKYPVLWVDVSELYGLVPSRT